MYFNCLAVVSERGLCGGGEDVFDVNEGKTFPRTHKRWRTDIRVSFLKGISSKNECSTISLLIVIIQDVASS